MWFDLLLYLDYFSDDDSRFIQYLQEAGFYKEGEVNFPHKRSAVMKIKREFWEAPAL
jgi:hypothetical protein